MVDHFKRMDRLTQENDRMDRVCGMIYVVSIAFLMAMIAAVIVASFLRWD